MADILKDKGPSVHFFNTEHLEHSVDDIWDKAKDADIILMELVTETEFKTDIENVINYGAQVDTLEEKARVIDIVKLATNDKLFLGIAEKVILNGKQIYFIDVDADEPSDVEFKSAFVHFQNSLTFFRQKNYQTSFSEYVKFIDMFASSSKEREEIVTDQIQGILDNNQDALAGKRVLVLQGAMHSGVFHKIKLGNPGRDIQRSFLTPDFQFAASHALARKIIFGRDATPDDYKKAYFSAVVVAKVLMDIPKYEFLPDQEHFKKCAEVMKKINQKEFDDYWIRLMEGKLDVKQTVGKYI